MANSKSSRKDDYSTMKLKNFVTRSGRKSTQFNVSVTEKTSENKRTPVSKNLVSTGKKFTSSKTPQLEKNSEKREITRSGRKSTQFDVSFTDKTSENKRTPVSKNLVSTGKKFTSSKTPQLEKNSEKRESQNGNNLSHNSPISDLEISDTINYSDNEEKTLKKPALRCRKRIDYAEMFRGSSIINEKVPVVLLNKIPDQEKIVSSTKTECFVKVHRLPPEEVLNLTKKRHKVYSTIHNFEENIRPSQVYEFNFDPKCESELTKKLKKEAKVLKKKIKAKVHLKKNAVKTGENAKKTQTISKNALNVLHEISENDCSTNNSTKNQSTEKLMDKERIIHSFRKSFQVPQSTPKDKEAKNINKSSEICKENHLITNQVNSLSKNLPTQISRDNSTVHESFDKVRISNSFGNSFKAPQSTPIQKGVKNNTLNKSQIPTENVNIPKNAPIQNTRDNSTTHEYFDKSIISFGNSLTPMQKSIHQNEQNHSNFDVTQIEHDFDDFEDISTQSNRTEIANESIPWRAEIPRIRKERFFQIKNSSLPSYNQDILIKPQDVENLSITKGSNCVNSEKKTRQSSILSFVQHSNSIKSTSNNGKDSPAPFTNSFESSLSDISIEDNPRIVAIDKTKNKRINFQKAITSSPSVKKNILGENNSSSKVQNISTNKNNVKSPTKKILGENNSSSKVHNITNKKVYDENNKENFYFGNNVNITNNCVVELEKSNSSCDFFGFNSFEQEEARQSKKPFRYPSLLPAISSRTKKILQPFTVHEENIDIPNEDMVEEPIDISNENEVIDADFQLFDEPRFSNYVRRSYAPATKRKRKQIQSISFSDHEDENELQQEVKKRKRNKKTKKEEEEFKKWAKQFNSMCQEVDKEELVIE
ncbi:uncharacterized protein DDB_G0288805-like [Chrysoperla carnea]|uniref:uncharacterized protein DDB_G0288805-like n=1 Tax=Chrysoperla carnea TaxID=189513 RepID=UPI001D0641B1|nr:uncharacterized protein DDB_G0288805-like [Chrysoperla carnea]